MDTKLQLSDVCRRNVQVFGYHEVFHALVILASVLHFAAVYLLVQKIAT